MGPPGAGKGSLAHLCVTDLGWQQLSTGNLCRKHIAIQSEIGKSIDFAIKSGKLISDDLITRMVTDWLSENISADEIVILDGFPRTIAQADVFNTLLKTAYNDCKLRVVRLTIPDDEVVMRLTNRFICKNKDCQTAYSMRKGSNLGPKVALRCDSCGSDLERRADDEESTIRERLAIYHKHEQDMLNFYARIGQPIYELDSAMSLTSIFLQFKKIMEREAS